LKDRPQSETFGERLKKIRTSKGLTQEQLAESINVTKKVISDYETGKNRIYGEMLAQISLALNVSADLLLGLKIEEKVMDEQSLKLMKRFKKIQEMDLKEQNIIIQSMDIMIKGISSEDK
jgi:repressor LexA